MKVRLFLKVFIFLFLGMVTLNFYSQGVYIVQKSGVSAYEEVKNTFIQMSFVEQILNLQTPPILLDGSEKDSKTVAQLAEKKPSCIFAIGSYSVKKVREVLKDVPIVCAMDYYPEIDKIYDDEKCVVINSIGSEKQLLNDLKNFKKIKRIGILHLDTISRTASEIAYRFSEEKVEVEDLPFSRKDDLSNIFGNLKGKLQTLLFLNNLDGDDSDTINFIVTNCNSLDIFPVAFNDQIVSKGFLYGCYFSGESIAQTSAKVVKDIVTTNQIPQNRFITPKDTTNSVNKKTLNDFKLKIPSNMKIGVMYE